MSTADHRHDEIFDALQRWITRHPVAAQAAFVALAALGREQARSPEGEELRRRLARSKVARRARERWDAITAGTFVEDPEVVIPSPVIEALARTIAARQLEKRGGDGAG